MKQSTEKKAAAVRSCEADGRDERTATLSITKHTRAQAGVEPNECCFSADGNFTRLVHGPHTLSSTAEIDFAGSKTIAENQRTRKA